MSSTRLLTSALLGAGLTLLSSCSSEHTSPQSRSDALTPGWTTLAPMPIARAQHAAVLLGSGKLLVLNGVNRQGFVGGADLYDPANDTWSALGAIGIQGNVAYALLLSNGKALVTTDGSLGGRVFDPETNTWSATANTMAQTRGLPSLTTLASGQVLIAGGTGAGGVRLASSELYDPTSNTFTATGSMTLGRGAHTSTSLRDGRVLAVSGFNQAGEVPGADLYDPVAGTWTAAAPPLVPRHYASSTLLPDGRVLFAGGFAAGGVTTHAELYDPISNTWTATGALARPRSGHMATLLPNGKVLASGGSDGARNAQTIAELYDPATGTWSNAGTMQIGRENHSATLLPSGKVLGVGGYSSNPSLTFYTETELYEPASDVWNPSGALSVTRLDPLVSSLPDGDVLVVGGRAPNSTGLLSAERYRRATNTWTPAAALAAAHVDGTLTLLPSGQLLVVGGIGNAGALATAERFDAVANTWTAAAPMAAARSAHTATPLPDGTLLIVGGRQGNVTLGSVERFDPRTNTWSPAAAITPPRSAHAAALLPSGKVLVVGGRDAAGAALTSATLYDPATNTWTAAASLAQSREQLSLALLPSGSVLATGGAASGVGRSTSELYDPTSNGWTAAGALAEPRFGHRTTLLPNGKLVLLGGFSAPAVASTTAQIYEPATKTWSPSAASALRAGIAVLTLPSGEALAVGGTGARSVERYDDTGANPSWHPTVTGPAVLYAACPNVIEGTQLRGIAPGSGGQVGNSPTDYPLVRLHDAGRLWSLPTTSWSATRATVNVPAGVPAGSYALSVLANAIPGGRMVKVQPNSAPVVQDRAVTTLLDTAVAVTIDGVDPDVEHTLQWELVDAPTHGAVSGALPNLTYTPNAEYIGPDMFTVRATDPCGQASNLATVRVDVTDHAPTIECPAAQIAEATGPDGATVSWPDATAADGNMVTYQPTKGSRFALGDHTVTASAENGSGQTSSCAFTVSVSDTTPPSLTCPENLRVTASDAAGARVSFTLPNAADAVSTPTVIASPASGTVFRPGPNTVTVTATDAAENSAQCTFQVDVQAVTASPDAGSGQTPPVGDGGTSTDEPDPSGESGGGCGCRTHGTNDAPWSLLLALVVGWVARRSASTESPSA